MPSNAAPISVNASVSEAAAKTVNIWVAGVGTGGDITAALQAVKKTASKRVIASILLILNLLY
jgi:cysteine synthase